MPNFSSLVNLGDVSEQSAATLYRMIALSLPTWQCVRQRNQEQADDPIDGQKGNAGLGKQGSI
jgi:hypothetical protein